MENNIYQSPRSNVNTEINEKGSPVKAVVAATTTDIIGTVLFGFIYFFIYGVVLSSEGISPDEINQVITNIDLYSIHSIIGIIIGLSISLYAGYLCAKIVNYNEYRIVTIYAVIMLIFSIIISGSHYSLTEEIVLHFLSLTCMYSGAWIYVKNKT